MRAGAEVRPERRQALNQMPSLTPAPDGFNVSLDRRQFFLEVRYCLRHFGLVRLRASKVEMPARARSVADIEGKRS